jgi:predicted DNA-binding transcriptional regulator AlpA
MTRRDADDRKTGDRPYSPIRDERYVARRLNVSPRTMQAWRWNGRGPRFVRVGRRVGYLDSDVDEWIASRTASSTTEADALEAER